MKKWLLERGIQHGVTVEQSDLIYNQGQLYFYYYYYYYYFASGLRSYKTSPLTSLCGGIQDLEEADNPSSPPLQKDIGSDPTSDPSHEQQDTGAPSPNEQGSDELPSAKSTDCPPSNGTTSPGGVSCVNHTLKTLRGHRTGLTVLVVMLGVILLGFILLFLVKVKSAWGRHRPRNQRYKSVSKYFPFSYEKQATEVVIPAVGMPKGGATERQVLLNDSDEDEL